MNNLKLSAKLGLGFGLVLLLTILVAAIGSNGFSSVVKRVNNSAMIGDIETQSIVILRTERNFVGDRNPKHMESVDKAVETINRLATEAAERHFKDPADKENM
ncbi:MAG: hypothetical protein H7834_08525 [Magnetococcus sp. YQC-9]